MCFGWEIRINYYCPAKSDSDVILFLQLLSKTRMHTWCEYIDHLCSAPARLFYKGALMSGALSLFITPCPKINHDLYFIFPYGQQKLCIQIDANRFSDFLFTLQSKVGNPPLRSRGELTSGMWIAICLIFSRRNGNFAISLLFPHICNVHFHLLNSFFFVFGNIKDIRGSR